MSHLGEATFSLFQGQLLTVGHGSQVLGWCMGGQQLFLSSAFSLLMDL